jgi:cell division protein FtsX
VQNKGAEVLLESAKIFIEEADLSLRERNYRKFFGSSIVALSYASGAYNGCVMPLINESGTFLLSFTPIVIVFSVLFERLVFHMYGLKKIIGVFIILTIILIILSILTPLFSIISNSIFMILGVGILLLSTFVIVIFLRESKEIMEYFAETKLGYHIVRTEKTAAMLHSLGVAVDNLRKHFFISVTALITIIIMSAAITTFTSVSYTVKAVPSTREGYTPLYEGILVKRLWGIPPDAQRGGVLDMPIIGYLDAIVGEDFLISPRVWKYPSSVYAPSIGVLGVKTPVETLKGIKMVIPLVLYGASSADIERTFSASLIYFNKHIFNSNKESCLIPRSLAEKLNVTVGMPISLKNPEVNLIIAGIFDASSELKDLDGWSIFPIDPMYSPTIYRIETPYTETTMPQPIKGDNIIIVNWEKARELGGLISSIAIIPKNQTKMEKIFEVASKIALGVDATIYVGYGSTIKSFNKVLTYEFEGWNFVVVLVILAILSIANNILATLHRRRNEVFVYASVGLSPTGAMLIFVIEGITYGILASVIGYLLGYGITWIFTTLYPGTLTFNTNSMFITVSLGAIIGSCIAASLYPSILAAKLITPSLERKWAPPTKPHGDIWSMPLPFRTPYKNEVLGLLKYLKEYYSGIGFERRGFVIQRISDVDVDNLALTVNITLLPSELNLNQEAKIYTIYGEIIISSL